MINLILLFVAAHIWKSSEDSIERLQEPMKFVYKDQSGDIPLISNMVNFNKLSHNEFLRSNYIGADCYTRPQLCNSGFSVSFDMESKLYCIL